MIWCEAVLFPALKVLFDKLASGDILNILKVWNVNEMLLDKLKISYFINTAVLDDAEEKQYLNPAVETWIDMLRDAVFEAEDILDELATEALRCKLEPDSQKFSQQMCRGTPSTPLLLRSHVYGRVAPFCVIPLIGMGGIGKTTLAQIVYNDKRICEEFDVKVWAWVSDDFSVASITKSLLESATAKPFDTNSLEIIQNGLKNLFSSKRFLIVLDDVWCESCDDWNELLIPFFEGDKRSKIIATTRNEGVASITGMLAPYHLQEMSHDHAFGVRGMEMNPRLKQIGEEIVKRCKGLPLAIKTLGEGFLQPMAQITMEEVGNGNFTELQSRCFFQESTQNRSLFVMHDLVHDLALSVSRRTCIQLENPLDF
nr:putative disease resistance RPP13-like protein 1 [Solanum lycopersicum]